MPFKIVRNDITKVKADVIVNTANPNPICASGTDLAIYEAAGKEKLLAERANIGNLDRTLVLRMPYEMQYHLVVILTRLVLLQVVLQKHFMEFRLY